MTDFPAMNNNSHATSLLRVCAIEPLMSGTYTLDLPLLKLEVSPNSITGKYSPIVSDIRELHLRLASQPATYAAFIDGKEVNSLMVEGEFILSLNLSAGQPTQFDVVSTKGVH
jgi:hypothetical protein